MCRPVFVRNKLSILAILVSNRAWSLSSSVELGMAFSSLKFSRLFPLPLYPEGPPPPRGKGKRRLNFRLGLDASQLSKDQRIRDAAVVPLDHQCGSGSIANRCHIWVEFVVCSCFGPTVFIWVLRFSSLFRSQDLDSQFDQGEDQLRLMRIPL